MAENNEEGLISFLKQHSDKEFVRRILEPSLNKNPVQNSTGTTSTHSMAAEQDKEGNWYVFPTVVNQGGKLVRYEDPFAAMDENFKTGEYISFGKDGDSATKFAAGGYKTKAFKEYGTEPNQPAKTRQSQSANKSNLFNNIGSNTEIADILRTNPSKNQAGLISSILERLNVK
jgi:hypothetical protein